MALHPSMVVYGPLIGDWPVRETKRRKISSALGEFLMEWGMLAWGGPLGSAPEVVSWRR